MSLSHHKHHVVIVQPNGIHNKQRQPQVVSCSNNHQLCTLMVYQRWLPTNSHSFPLAYSWSIPTFLPRRNTRNMRRHHLGSLQLITRRIHLLSERANNTSKQSNQMLLELNNDIVSLNMQESRIPNRWVCTSFFFLQTITW